MLGSANIVAAAIDNVLLQLLQQTTATTENVRYLQSYRNLFYTKPQPNPLHFSYYYYYYYYFYYHYYYYYYHDDDRETMKLSLLQLPIW